MRIFFYPFLLWIKNSYKNKWRIIEFWSKNRRIYPFQLFLVDVSTVWLHNVKDMHEWINVFWYIEQIVNRCDLSPNWSLFYARRIVSCIKYGHCIAASSMTCQGWLCIYIHSRLMTSEYKSNIDIINISIGLRKV